jgi:hypothetical protein
VLGWRTDHHWSDVIQTQSGDATVGQSDAEESSSFVSSIDIRADTFNLQSQTGGSNWVFMNIVESHIADGSDANRWTASAQRQLSRPPRSAPSVEGQFECR